MMMSSLAAQARALVPAATLTDARTAVRSAHRAAERFDVLDAGVVQSLATHDVAGARTGVSELGEVVAGVGLSSRVYGDFLAAHARTGAASIDYAAVAADPARTIAQIGTLHEGLVPLHRSMMQRLNALHALTEAAARR